MQPPRSHDGPSKVGQLDLGTPHGTHFSSHFPLLYCSSHIQSLRHLLCITRKSFNEKRTEREGHRMVHQPQQRKHIILGFENEEGGGGAFSEKMGTFQNAW